MGEAAAEWVELASLHPWKKNPRKNDGAPVDKVLASLKRYGWGRTLVARRDGELIIGHTTRKAVIQLVREFKAGADTSEWHAEALRTAKTGTVPVRFRDDLSEDAAHELAIADNKTGEASRWDGGTLEGLLGDWSDAGADLSALGFDGSELARAMGVTEEVDAVELDISDLLAVEFLMQIRGPLGSQVAVIDQLKKALGDIPGVSVEVTVA